LKRQQNTRARALIAIGALTALAILVVAILAVGGGAAPSAAAAAPPECVEEWNSSRDALSTGVHNRVSHRYSRVQVAYASEDGATVAAEPIPGGGCVVIFAAQALDPEPASAAEIKIDDRWVPMSGRVGLGRLAQLQSDALGAANALLGSDGRVSPLDS